MTLHLLVDESADSRTLRRLLVAAGHTVITAADVGLLGARDTELFAYAQAHGLAILTKNPVDFYALHLHNRRHEGILLVYKDNDRTRDMTDAQIVQAIGSLLTAEVPLAGEIYPLNHWRY